MRALLRNCETPYKVLSRILAQGAPLDDVTARHFEAFERWNLILHRIWATNSSE